MTDPAVQQQLVPLLRQVGIFSRCTDKELMIVARKSTVRDFAAGERILTQGEMGDELFLVLAGSARVEGLTGKEVTFGPGDHFGELAALLPAPRISDVVAVERTLTASMQRDVVYSLFDAIPGVARKMLEGLAASLRESHQVPAV
jgi:CRP-like cAMP-binding protein